MFCSFDILIRQELLFLLEELVLKLTFKLPAPSAFGGFPGRAPNVSIHRNLEMTQANKVGPHISLRGPQAFTATLGC